MLSIKKSGVEPSTKQMEMVARSFDFKGNNAFELIN